MDKLLKAWENYEKWDSSPSYAGQDKHSAPACNLPANYSMSHGDVASDHINDVIEMVAPTPPAVAQDDLRDAARYRAIRHNGYVSSYTPDGLDRIADSAIAAQAGVKGGV